MFVDRKGVKMAAKFSTKEELINKVKTIVGKKVGDYDVDEVLKNPNSKGNIGHVVEQGFFGYNINNDQAPDFENLGIELKVTGYKWVRKEKQVSAKERLVITMVDFFNDINVDFYDSHLFNKIANMLLILYEYEPDKNTYEFIITNYFMYEYENIPEKDKIIIENDWKTINNKIIDGKAHELSEGDTFYLGACPKGANRLSLTSQPFSTEMAMRRAFSLKTTYMTELFRNHIFHEYESKESFIKSIKNLKERTFEEIIYETFRPYIGLSLSQIDSLLEEPVQRQNNKQYIRSYIARMMRVQRNHLDSLEEFDKANIQIKTVRLTKYGRLKESMSFPGFDFVEVANEEWETSELREMFSATKFLFVVFKEIDDSIREYEFIGVKLWNMPISDIEGKVRQVWEKTNSILNGELVLNIRNNRVLNNFPKMSDDLLVHVRPHARVRAQTNPLPQSTEIKIESNDNSVDLSYLDGNRFTRQCFWLNSSYVLSVLDGINKKK
jgi:DNA mismatch repair protein MutH